jgi:hypothetical protein
MSAYHHISISIYTSLLYMKWRIWWLVDKNQRLTTKWGQSTPKCHPLPYLEFFSPKTNKLFAIHPYSKSPKKISLTEPYNDHVDALKPIWCTKTDQSTFWWLLPIVGHTNAVLGHPVRL